MKKNITKVIATSLFMVAASLPSYASMAGLCNDKNYTQYICCPANGGWIVSSECDSGASPNCVDNTGLIAGSNPQVTILQDCQNRGGTYVTYPFSKTKK